ncbi:MAG: hypothetical protein H0U99_05360, partial [Chthoniobacterales bacterium]|nr:hypothetical protein [Chthoniobacterales bacterium]
LTAFAQEIAERNVVVSAEEDEAEHNQFTEPGEYAQPAWAERSRMSASTSVYVLSPYEIFGGLLWQAEARRHGKVRHELIQQLDVGLPRRFELGIENEVGALGGDVRETSVMLEVRYAFANWNTIPLNPAISVEYLQGVGRSVRLSNDFELGQTKLRRQPNAIATRILCGQNFGEQVAYGLNLSLLQNVSREHGREFEVNQSVSYGLMKGHFEVGAEMRFTLTMETHSRDIAELLIGPDFAWKPTRQMRIGIAPLFGCTHDSSGAAISTLISYEFGGAESIVAPISHPSP